MTSRKSIFKLSAREEREVGELIARKRRARLSKENFAAQHSDAQWDFLRDKFASNLTFLDGNGEPMKADPLPRLSVLARKNIAVFERDGFTCRDCFKGFDHPHPYHGEPIPGLTRGHIIPDAQGGTAAISNLIAQCSECNWALGNQVWNPNALSTGGNMSANSYDNGHTEKWESA